MALFLDQDPALPGSGYRGVGRKPRSYHKVGRRRPGPDLIPTRLARRIRDNLKRSRATLMRTLETAPAGERASIRGILRRLDRTAAAGQDGGGAGGPVVSAAKRKVGGR